MGESIERKTELCIVQKEINLTSIVAHACLQKFQLLTTNESMKRLFIFLILFFLPVNILASELPTVDGVLNVDTGELFWDLNSGYRLQYVSPCELISNTGYSNMFLFVEGLPIEDLDYFDDKEKYVNCENSGLRVINRLTQDGGFSYNEKEKIYIEINDKEISIDTKVTDHFSAQFNHTNNFKPIYVSMVVNSEVVVRVYYSNLDFSERVNQAFNFYNTTITSKSEKVDSDPFKLIFEGIIDTTNIAKSDNITRQVLQEEANIHNKKLQNKLYLLCFYNLILIVFVILFHLFITIKIFKFVKNKYSKYKPKVKDQLSSFFSTESRNSNIIKSGKLKSYSVADELLKWNKLKEDGIVSEEEYNQARNKLFER
jgi:hypothetical protein